MRKIVLAILRLCYKIGPNDKNPPKIRFEKIVKLKDHSYVCKSLINFPYKTYTLNDWKRKLCLSAETCLEKNLWNHNLQVNLFSADFSHLEPLCATLYRTEPCIYILLSIFFHRLFRLLSRMQICIPQTICPTQLSSWGLKSRTLVNRQNAGNLQLEFETRLNFHSKPSFCLHFLKMQEDTVLPQAGCSTLNCDLFHLCRFNFPLIYHFYSIMTT